MKASGIKRMLVKAILNKGRIILVGKPGLGKTALVKQARTEVSTMLNQDIDMITLYGSISDPTDFKGYPAIIAGKGTFVPFGDLEKIITANRLMILFMDDLGLSMPATQGAMMSLLDKLKDNPNVVVIGATNGRGDRANVSGLLEPVKSRFDSIINMEFSMDDWIADFAIGAVEAGTMPLELVAFNRFRPDLMYSVKPSADLVNGPCPRTVEALGKLMMMDLDTEDQYEAFSGAVGEAYTAELMGFLPVWKKLPSIAQILQDPVGAAIPDSTDKSAASIYFAITAALSKKCSDVNFERICKYAARLPKEAEVMLVTDCIRRVPACKDTMAYIKWESANRNIMI
jgi:hypothetical protein